ncbi:MAG: glycine cleavage system protein T [Chloroflexi bacterium]|nr:glycine cleavage system protein T [Chloroflexota bacterium]MCC6896428.1 aminomethyltransferase family protein [Anaerolineae bacterium]
MNLHDLHQQAGASVAPDGIPLQFGDQQAEYEAALQAAVLMDRSHEGRFETVGRDRFEVINRISTNDVIHMAAGEGRPTILTSVTGRIIDRLMVYNRGELALVTTEPGRSQAVRDSLQRQIFFNDEMRIIDLGGSTKQFALHGPSVQAILQTFSPDAGKHEYLEAVNATIGDGEVILLQRKAFVGDHWIVIVPNEQAAAVWQALLEAGAVHGLQAAGSLVYNALRIRAGRPAAGRELSQDYIPLEAGLWDEVSFKKGCYTGQEIIARMESRNRLAKIMVTLSLEQMVNAPAPLYRDGREVGTLTSSVVSPAGEILGVGFVKFNHAEIGQTFTAGHQNATARILTYAGAPAPMIEDRQI